MDNGDGTVTDRATGLMWQQSGSEAPFTYEEAKEYIAKLNREKFAGYSDWRLPTVDELMSLLEPKEMGNSLHIDPVFDSKQSWCWTSDTVSSGGAFFVRFDYGSVDWDYPYSYSSFVRGIRPVQ